MKNRRQDNLLCIRLNPQDPELPHGDLRELVGLAVGGGGGGLCEGAKAGSFIFFGMAYGKVRENEFQMMGQNSRFKTHFYSPVGLTHPWTWFQ